MGVISSCCRSSGSGGNSGASGDGTAGGGGSALDRVIAQASGQDNCLLYRLADYKNGGELLEAFATGGQHEVERLIREQFGVFMYADGKGQVINRAEYLRWKFRSQTEVVVPIETSLSAMDPLSRWHDHEACWQMQYRGSLGEALLHVLIICDTKTHTRLARTLLKCFPKLALDVVEGEEYLGASALHLAIAYSNNELVRDLVDAGADVSQRAIGTFFLPRDQQRPRPARHTDYEGLAYLGEFPLAWAACCANESVYNLLIDAGADPDAQDSFGNVILHMVVVCDKLDMFGYALRHPKLPASNGITNHAGLTPLTLACKLGRAEVFREMLELSAREFWRYSNITCSAYPLNALDTLLPDGRTNWNSALFIILNGTKEEHLDMLDGGIIQRLLEEKWKTFARRQFLKRLAILFLHLLTLSTAVYLRPSDRNAPLLGGMEWQDIARYCFEIGTVLGVLSYVLFQQGGEIKNQGLVSFLKQQTHAPAKAIFLVSNLLILACIPFRLANDKRTEEAILLFAVPGSWFLLMFFAGAVRLTGPFVTMVYSMITGDMLTFGIIYSVMLFGFSQSFFFLYKGSPAAKTSLYGSYPSTWMALFQITLGDYNYSELSYTTYPTLSKAVFAIFMVLVPILLLNMLIAMMGNTYAHVIEQSEKEWMKQWAKIVVTLERAVNQADAHHYLQEYSIKLGPGGGDDPNATEQRGVMVIKSKSKTRAKQRKGAVSNWKRVGKVTITELRKRGMTGEQLRRIMWGRASISTPTHANLIASALGVTATDGDAEGNGDGPPSGPTATDALTAALDQIAFAHDIDLKGAAAGLPDPPPDYTTSISPAADNVSVKPSNESKAGAEKPSGAKMNERSATLPWNLEGKNSQEIQSKEHSWIHAEDPLHLLVIGDGSLEAETAAALAAAAAERCHLHAANQSPQVLLPNNKEESKQVIPQRATIIDIEPSDSDGLEQSGVDGPLLGRSARMYRARSSKWRYPSSNNHNQSISIAAQNHNKNQMGWHWPRGGTSYEKWGWQRADSSSSSTNSEGYINYGLILSPDMPAVCCTETITPADGKAQLNYEKKGSKREHSSHMRRKLRPKTTKPRTSNRVAPKKGLGASNQLPTRPATAGQVDEMGIDSEDGEHAENSSDNTIPGWRRDLITPVPWSTQPIANMNTLLAWDKSDAEDKDADDDL